MSKNIDNANESVSKVSVEKKPAKAVKTTKKSGKKIAQKENFFVRIGTKLAKLCKDTVGEMKKVVWTPKAEVKKSTKLVVVTVIAIGVLIAVLDTACSYLINTVAGLIG